MDIKNIEVSTITFKEITDRFNESIQKLLIRLKKAECDYDKKNLEKGIIEEFLKFDNHIYAALKIIKGY